MPTAYSGDRAQLRLLPTTGTKLYRYDGIGRRIYAELFDDEENKTIFAAFDAALKATGFQAERSWGERIEDRGSQVTFSALGQQAPLDAKEQPDLDFAKRKLIQADLRQRLPGFSTASCRTRTSTHANIAHDFAKVRIVILQDRGGNDHGQLWSHSSCIGKALCNQQSDRPRYQQT